MSRRTGLALVDTETGELVDRRDVAQRLTEEIRGHLGAIVEHRDQVLPLIVEARESGVYEDLGYPSWTAYVAEEFADVLPRLDASERAPLAAQLRALGMSTRAIAPILGVDQKTVVNDVRGEEFSSPADPPPVTGRDGKTYAPSPPGPEARPRRTPLVDSARNAGIDLRKITDRLDRLAHDDRLRSNKSEVAAHLRHHLAHAIKVCQDLNACLNENGV